jgi:micrococcal nuclease
LRLCVIDGDTFFFAGEKIRIADIDAPETGGAQCANEAELGARATSRLQELLNEGPFELRGYQSRDTDRYGRKLRVVVRDGRSIGDTLVAEGLARRWSGRRLPWCA